MVEERVVLLQGNEHLETELASAMREKLYYENLCTDYRHIQVETEELIYEKNQLIWDLEGELRLSVERLTANPDFTLST